MSSSTRIRFTLALTALIAGAAIAAVTSMALAKSIDTLQTTHNAKLGETIVIGSTGRTLYVLSPETTRHLLCKSSACFGFWPPVKVSKKAKLTAAKGIKGKLGKLHRDGFYQVTLAGHPLYMFSEDSGKGDANGNGIKSFGGTWHVLAASASKPASTTTTKTTTTSMSTTSTYSYPSY